MNRFHKAAEFGAVMGKRAGLLKHSDAAFFPKQTKDYPGSTSAPKPTKPTYPALLGMAYPNMPLRGGPHNPAGALPRAGTLPQLPYASKDDGAYSNMETWNYSSPEGMGTPRKTFHTGLTNELNRSNNFDAWNKRMGDIADEKSKKAPLSHVVWPSQGYGPPRPALGNALYSNRYDEPHSSRLYPPNPVSHSLSNAPAGILNSDVSPKAKTEELYSAERKIPYAYAPRSYADSVTASNYPRSFSSHGNLAVHEGTHAGDQKFPDSKMPFTVADLKGGYTDEKGNRSPNYGDLTGDDRRSAVETAATWNEVAQGSRAFKDVTGKNLPGAYTFAPGMDMDYREMADLAKKYRVGDLNTPTGQKFMQQVLRNSKTNAPTAPPVDLNHPSIRDFKQDEVDEAKAKYNKAIAASNAIPKDAPYEVWGPAHGDKLKAERNYIRASNPAQQHPGPKFNSKGSITYPAVSSYGPANYYRDDSNFISAPQYPAGYPYGPERYPPGYGNK
jgi:hypothetical protein